MWSKAKDNAQPYLDSVFKVADKVGFWTNKQVAKMGVEAFYPTSLDVEVIKAARILRTFTLDASVTEEPHLDRKKTQRVIKKIPPSALDKCCGLAIYTVFRMGLGFSGAGGSGIVIGKLADGSWSAPSGILLHTLGWGLLAGMDVYDVVLILRTPAAVKAFTHPRITVGGEVTVTAGSVQTLSVILALNRACPVGPVGNGAMLEAGMELSPVWSYVKSKGLYGGLQVDGNIIIERTDENARAYYRSGVKAQEILDGAIFAPAWCAPLHQTILAASGRPTATDRIPSGPSAGDMGLPPPRKLEKEDEDYDDLVARAEMEEFLIKSGIEDPKINRRHQSTDEFLVIENPSTSTSLSPSLRSGPSTSATGAPSPIPPPRPPRRFMAPLPNQSSPAPSDDLISMSDPALSPPTVPPTDGYGEHVDVDPYTESEIPEVCEQLPSHSVEDNDVAVSP